MTARKRATSYHHGDLRAALLAATEALVRSEGIRAVTLRDVAKRAGVSEAAPYHHFTNKSDLLLATAANGYRLLAKALATAAGGITDARAQLVEIGGGYVAFALDEPGYFRLLFGAHINEMIQQSLPSIEEAQQAGRSAAAWLSDGVARFVADTAATVEPVALQRVFWAQVHGLAWLIVEDEIHPSPTRAEAIDLARQGVELVLAGASQRRARRR